MCLRKQWLRSALTMAALWGGNCRPEPAGRTPVDDGSSLVLPGHVLPALATARILPAAEGEANERLTISVVLRRSDQSGFESYLRDVQDPHSPHYGRFLAQEELGERFGPAGSAYDSVLAW